MTDKHENSTKKHGGGPKTPEGKQRSSRNSTQHGLTAQLVVMHYEDPAAFQALLEGYLEDFRPSSHVAVDLVHELAACRWRLRRIWDIEGWNLSNALGERTRYNPPADPDVPESMIAALAFRDLARKNNFLSILNRYEARFTHRMHQILAELKALGCVPPAANDTAPPQHRTAPRSKSSAAPREPQPQPPVTETPAARLFYYVPDFIPPEVLAA